MMSGEEWDSSYDDTDSTQKSGSNNVAKKSNQGLASKMFSYANSFFFAGIIFTILVALQSSPPKVSKPPIARPFFNQSSIVTDFYKGHLNALIERIMDSDFSFIMYYAPWDAESQALRAEMEIVTKYYHSQIFFAAINCWHPGSECRAQVNKIQSYPVLMLYPSKHTGIQYKGIKTAPYMIKFIDAVLKPIVRITDKVQFENLILEHDAVVVGFFNFTGVSKSTGYKEFYITALRSLERNPNQEILFAAITDTKTAELNFSVATFPHSKLFMWNESISFPETDEWTTDNILNWSEKEMHRVTLWLQPPGSKSQTFAPYLWDGPALFLFTPRNPLHKENYNYNLLKEKALKYYNCADNIIADELARRLREKSGEAFVRHQKRSKECLELSRNLNNQNLAPPVSVSIQQWINDTCCAQIVMNKCLLCKRKVSIEKMEESVCSIPLKEFNKVCLEKDVFRVSSKLESDNEYELCCRKNIEENILTESAINTSHDSEETDPYSSLEIQKFFHKDECQRFLLGNKYQRPVFPKSDKNEEDINLTPLICEVNKTLSFIAVDSLYYFHFAEGLGVDISSLKDKTAVVILDPKEESHYIMKEEFSLNSLTQFINNYTEGLLQRNLRSEKSKRFAHSYKKDVNCKIINKSTVCVPELTTENFLETVLDSKKDVVVLYHSPYCGFCSAIAYVYLSVAHYLSKMDHLIFVRVDGDNNDLPWEYSMDKYPSILFFPAKRKEDSTVYPFSLPITVANLLNFVVANLEGDSHVEALVNICHIGAGESSKDCVFRIRSLCLDLIDDLLRDYRRLQRHDSVFGKRIANTKRRLILLKLNHIRSINLILESTDNLVKDTDKVKLIQYKFKAYYRTISQLDGNIKKSNKSKLKTRNNSLKDEL